MSVVDCDTDGESKIVTKGLANVYRMELASQRSSRGNGPPLDASEMLKRVVRLRRRSATLPIRYRLADQKALEQLDRGLPSHVTVEADRAIGALTLKIRAVGGSVEAARHEIRETREEVRTVRAELGALC